MSFLNPLLLFGMAAVAVPIIIHLLNRRKFRKVNWAAMKFVKLSIDQNQRRMKLEDLILLLLRCALLALLALALARPVMRQSESSFMGQTGVTSVLVLDNSFSMGLEDGEATRFQRAKAACTNILDSLPSGSSVARRWLRATLSGPRRRRGSCRWGACCSQVGLSLTCGRPRPSQP